MLITGGAKPKNSSSKKMSRNRRIKGGSMPSLSPATLTAREMVGSSTTPMPGAENYNETPLTVPSSTMVGGGYGFDAASVADIPSFAGSYIPVSRVCLDSTPDNNSRGGNNFTQGGGKKRKGKGKRGGTKKRRGSAKRRTMKKWRQRGCNKKRGCKTY